MKIQALLLVCISILSLASCSKSDSPSDEREIIKAIATVSDNEWIATVGSNRIFAEFAFIPAGDFPANPSKSQIDSMIDTFSDGVDVEASADLPIGEYYIVVRVSDVGGFYKKLTGAYTYKKVTNNSNSPTFVMEFDYNGSNGYHPWKDGKVVIK